MHDDVEQRLAMIPQLSPFGRDWIESGRNPAAARRAPPLSDDCIEILKKGPRTLL